jgi:transglutaminase-like putative cysteine protease
MTGDADWYYMPRTYRLLTAFLGLTGCVGLVITGELNPFMAAGGLAILPGYYRFLKGRGAAPGWVVGMCSVLTLAVFLFDSFVFGDFFIAVAHLTITFQAIKSYDLKEPWDHLQVYFMSLLQMVIASELSQSIIFGVVFIFFLVALVAAMVFSHFVKEGDQGEVRLSRPVAMIALLSVLLTAVLFLSLPRTSFSLLGRSHVKGMRTSGFAERVDFGSFGEVKLDPSVVMRIELTENVPPPYYWRGKSLDFFDGKLWLNTVQNRYRAVKMGDEYQFGSYDRKSAVEQQIYLEPIDSDIIFGLVEMKAIKVDSFFVRSDRGDSVSFSRKAARRAFYTVYSVLSNSVPGVKESRYLQFPPVLKRVRSLARDITSAARTDRERAVLIDRYLKKNYTYSLAVSPPAEGVSPIEDFLFYSKRGFCEHYATSMVLMLRGVGIPSRIVNGFYGGETNKYGGYIIVRQSDAHSWVEALIENRWMRFDPTPSVPSEHLPAITLFMDWVKMNWGRYVVGFKAEDQRSILKFLGSLPGLPALYFLEGGKARPFWYIIPSVLLLFPLIYSVRKVMIRKRQSFVSRKYVILRKAMAGQGRVFARSVTPEEILNEAAGLEAEGEVREFMRLYQEHRFGRRQVSQDERKRYDLLLRSIKRGLKRRSS